MDAFDPIAVIEASYQLESSDEDWMSGILEEVRPAWDDGFGLGMYEIELDEDFTPHVGALVARGADPELFRDVVLNMNREMGDTEIDAVYRARFVHATASERVADAVPDFRDDPVYREFGHPHGVYDFLGVQIGDPSGTLLIMGAPIGEVRATTRDERHDWARIAAHIAAGYRLRARSAGRQVAEDDVDAVLTPDGEVEHINPEALDPDASRAGLERAAQDQGRARGELRSAAPTEAVDLWKALVDGRYSLVDHVDTDGRQFLLARRNAPEVDEPEALSPRERQVVQFAATGHSNQLIGYELGLSASTVSTFLQRGLDKLNLDSRLELVRMWGATHRGG